MNGAVATASVLGGLAYGWWILLPWLLTVGAKLVGMVLVWFADEPNVDTDTFSWPNFLVQTRKGFGQLFSKSMVPVSLLLFTYGVFSTLAYELVDDMSVVAFGYDAVGIGILYSVVVFLAIPFSLLYQYLEKRLSTICLLFGAIGLLALNYVFSPWISVYVWTGIFLVRVIYSPIKEAAITQVINTRTPSKIRATTISTYELVRKIPYLFIAGSVAVWLDAYGVKQLASGFGLMLIILSVPQLVYWLRRRRIYAKTG
jgi:hypothetical protein